MKTMERITANGFTVSRETTVTTTFIDRVAVQKSATVEKTVSETEGLDMKKPCGHEDTITRYRHNSYLRAGGTGTLKISGI